MVLAVAMCSTTAMAVSVWDGTTDTEWATDANGNYLIYTAQELAGLAQQVNAGNSYAGSTFLLMDDIDLNNHKDWTPIGYLNGRTCGGLLPDEVYFSGTFDGQNHKISNCYIYYYDNHNKWYNSAVVRITSGLFGAIDGATINDVALVNSYIYHNTPCYYNYCGGIVGYAKSGNIAGCSVINNTIEVYSPYTYGADYGTAYAGGICGASGNTSVSANNFRETTNTSISDCIVAGNTITADGSIRNGGDKPTSISSGAAKSDNQEYGSVAEMQAGIDAINRATILYNNLGIGNAPKTPYYIDVNTGMPTDKIYYALLGIDNTQVLEKSIRQDAQLIHNAAKMDFVHEGATYALYPAGEVFTVEFYLEGYSGNWQNVGYLIDAITDNNGHALEAAEVYRMVENGLDENGNPTYSYDTDRFLRKLRYEVVMPAAMTTLHYTTRFIDVATSVEDVEQESRIYGVSGRVVVDATETCEVRVVDMAGRMVYNGRVAEGRNEIALERGFYIVNGVKVVVR